jgi:hypothetical protein
MTQCNSLLTNETEAARASRKTYDSVRAELSPLPLGPAGEHAEVPDALSPMAYFNTESGEKWRAESSEDGLRLFRKTGDDEEKHIATFHDPEVSAEMSKDGRFGVFSKKIVGGQRDGVHDHAPATLADLNRRHAKHWGR